MNIIDKLGCDISGATPAALEAYERALATSQSWRSGAMDPLDVALQEAPAFVMAHVLTRVDAPGQPRSATHFCGTSGAGARRHATGEPARAAASRGNRRRARRRLRTRQERLGEVLNEHPRDVLALQVAHALDYLTGDIDWMRERVRAVLPAWSSDLPGYHAVLAMHAFSLEESGEYARAEQVAHEALALDPTDARAHHVMAHVFEMTDRAGAGVRWMNEHKAGWSEGTAVVTHCWWHVALFHLAQGEIGRVLSVYDRRIRGSHSSEVADLIDASSLLWRVDMYGGATGERWIELADAWAPHIDDRFCSFNDVHAMMAFVGARDWDRAQRLERALLASHSQPTRHGDTTRQLGLTVGRALMAFGRGNDTLATTLLASLPALAHRLGGSHAQRDVLHLTLMRAIERIRRTAGPVRNATPSIAAHA